MGIDGSTDWRKKLLHTIQTSYGRAPYFSEAFDIVRSCLDLARESLADFNLATIRTICTALNISTRKFELASNLDATGQATALLVSLVNAVSGTTYLSGDGADGYQHADEFTAAGLGLEYQRFVHPVYPQRAATQFVPGLSVIDALMNTGIQGTADMLEAMREVHRGV
jgi:hypothetical protein